MRSRLVVVLSVLVVVSSCTLERRDQIDGTGALQARPPAEKEIIHVPGVARLPVFSPAVRVGDLIFLSGQIGTVGGELRVIEGGVAAETRQTFANIIAVLDAAGATMDDLVKCTVFLADIADYQEMNEAYVEFFPGDPPARSAMAGSGLALGAKVEIECIARAP